MKLLTKVTAVAALVSGSLFANPIDVDLSDATTSVTNAGNALIALAIVMISISLVYSYIKKRA